MPKSPEQFDPMEQKYRRVGDLPEEHRAKFVDIEDGFVKNSAYKAFSDAEVLAELANTLKGGRITAVDVLYEKYLKESQKEEESLLERLSSSNYSYGDGPNKRYEKAIEDVLNSKAFSSSNKSFILKAIENSNGFLGTRLPREIYSDKKFMHEVININAELLFEYASPELRSDKEFVMDVIKKNKNGLLLRYVSDELREDEDIVLEAIQHEITPNDAVFKYASERLHDDANFVIKIIRIGNPTKIFSYVSEKLRADKKFVLDVMEKFVGSSYDFAAEIMPNVSGIVRADREFMLEGMKMYTSIIQYASEELRGDKEFMIQAMKICPYALASASEKLRNDKEVVRGAMGKWTAFSWASKELLSDRDFVLEAMRVDVEDLNVASEKLCFDKEMMIESAKLGGSPLKYYQESYKEAPAILSRLRSDKDFVDELASHNVKILEYASDDLLSDSRFMLEQIKKNKDALTYVSKELRKKIAKLLE